jgi:hypothetical protein
MLDAKGMCPQIVAREMSQDDVATAIDIGRMIVSSRNPAWQTFDSRLVQNKNANSQVNGSQSKHKLVSRCRWLFRLKSSMLRAGQTFVQMRLQGFIFTT